MNEKNLIKELFKSMPTSKTHLNKPFESDAEVLEIYGNKLLFSTDEFSEEDMFLESDPYILGSNIAVAALSDIYASGGIPQFYAHSLTINKMFTDRYLKRFYEGIADVLKNANASFIGGDFGKAESWRCCASVMGITQKPILRSGAKVGDDIYITGPIGGGNIQAAMKMFHAPYKKIKFSLRNKEAEVIRKYATACIDTSDGVYSAINTLSEMSGVGFEIHHLPYLKLGSAIAKMLGLPKELLFFCECGEYELLFTAPPTIHLPFYKIGKVIPSGKLLHSRDISKMNISAREFESTKDYLRMMKKLCEELL